MPYVTGNCFGRCGAGCGSSHAYTKDCVDHDGCVRNGHTLLSFWCADEALQAADDELFAGSCY